MVQTIDESKLRSLHGPRLPIPPPPFLSFLPSASLMYTKTIQVKLALGKEFIVYTVKLQE